MLIIMFVGMTACTYRIFAEETLVYAAWIIL